MFNIVIVCLQFIKCTFANMLSSYEAIDHSKNANFCVFSRFHRSMSNTVDVIMITARASVFNAALLLQYGVLNNFFRFVFFQTLIKVTNNNVNRFTTLCIWFRSSTIFVYRRNKSRDEPSLYVGSVFVHL